MPDALDAAMVDADKVHVYWLAQCASDVALDDFWLNARELVCMERLRFPRRRADWRLGRWTAKCALAARLNLPALDQIEIRPASSGAPEVFLAGEPAPVTISLSHRNAMGLCAVAGPGAALGCDLERIEHRIGSFAADYFTSEERDIVVLAPTSERDRIITVIWSAKESALKALRVGLRADTRDVSVSELDISSGEHDRWYRVRIRHRSGSSMTGWWLCTEDFVRTIVTVPSCHEPIRLSWTNPVLLLACR